MTKKIEIGHNSTTKSISDKKIKETVKTVVINSFESWKNNNLVLIIYYN